MEYLSVLESLNELGTVAKLPTLVNIFDKLLDSEAPVLTRRCWRAINVRSRLTASELGEFAVANKLMQSWLVQSVHNPRINFMSAIKSKGGSSSVEHKPARPPHSNSRAAALLTQPTSSWGSSTLSLGHRRFP